MDSTRSSLNKPQFKIHQSIPIGSITKGHQEILRSADLNDNITILRRFAEGSIPLFEREDIIVNQPFAEESHGSKTSHDPKDSCKDKNQKKNSSIEPSSPKRKSADKLPRYRDERRERERRRRMGECSHSRSHTPPPTSGRRFSSPLIRNRVIGSPSKRRCSSSRDKNYSPYRSSKTRRSQTRSKSRTPSSTRRVCERDSSKDKHLKSSSSESSSPERYRHKINKNHAYPSSSRKKNTRRSRSRSPTRISSPKYSPQLSRRRSSSRNSNYSPYRSFVRDNRNRRSPSHAESGTPSSTRVRDHHRYHSSRERHKELKDNLNDLTAPVITAPPPQIIPIAVPVPAPDYGYTFPGWTTTSQASWHAPLHRPSIVPSHYASFPMLPMMPPLRATQQSPYDVLATPLLYGSMQLGYQPHTSHR